MYYCGSIEREKKCIITEILGLSRTMTLTVMITQGRNSVI